MADITTVWMNYRPEPFVLDEGAFLREAVGLLGDPDGAIRRVEGVAAYFKRSAASRKGWRARKAMQKARAGE